MSVVAVSSDKNADMHTVYHNRTPVLSPSGRLRSVPSVPPVKQDRLTPEYTWIDHSCMKTPDTRIDRHLLALPATRPQGNHPVSTSLSSGK